MTTQITAIGSTGGTAADRNAPAPVPMRVGYVMNTYPLVSTTFIGREIAALERQGVEVRRYAIRPWTGTLVDPDDKDEQTRTQYLLGDRLRIARSVVRELFRSPPRFLAAVGMTLRLIGNARGYVVKHMAYLAEAMVLRGLAEQDGIGHVHAHFSVNSTTVAMLARELGGPEYSFTVHGPDELLIPIENSIAEKVARARFVACISNFARSQVMLFSRQSDWGKLAIVHCGVDPRRYGRKVRNGYGKRVLFVGRLAAQKGVPLLLEAVAALKPVCADLRLTIVGDGPDRQALEAACIALGIGDQLDFLGYQSQEAVAALLDEHDMLVLPSFAEGVPVVLMEAMAARLPVIASGVAGVPELVEDGVSGFVVPAGDVETLTRHLSDLLADPDLCARMGKAGRMKVEAAFESEAEAARLRTLFELSAGSARARPEPRAPGDGTFAAQH